MAEVTLNQILTSREERVKKQQEILEQFKCPVISFTMNIAGPVKTSPLIERAFFEGVRHLEICLNKDKVLFRDVSVKDTGCEAFFSINSEALKIKDICVNIEESLSIGRLFDMDVIDTDGNKIARKNIRGCYVCGAQGRACAAGRIHPVSELQMAAKKIIEDYFFLQDKEICSILAKKSLLDEVDTTPKPGLVDRRNNGSHRDMNIQLFKKSANTLKAYFGECFSIGKITAHLSHEEAFELIRKSGIIAEKDMYNATDGINTHKGVIYSMGILCASLGRLWSPQKPIADIEDICLESANIAKKAIKKDFENIDGTTAGGRLYLKHGLKGIRGEVASGFKSVLKTGLPLYESLINKNLTKNDAGAITLLHYISNVKDTNIYNRGGLEGAKYAKTTVANLLKHSPLPSETEIEVLDDEFIKRNLSPGGCADLLAITYFLYSLKYQKDV